MSTNKKLTIGIIGAGVMGKALLYGFLKSGLTEKKQIWALVKSESSQKKTQKETSVNVYTQYPKELKNTDVIFLCVKPYQIKKICDELSNQNLNKNTIIVSIAAGITLNSLEEFLPKNTPIIRAMPNTPCLVRQGLTVFCTNKNVNPQKKIWIKNLLSSTGVCIETEESYFNAITALSGSGPAYHLLIMEALIDGGVRVGLPRDLALEIVTQVTFGTAQMLKESGRHPAALRDEVTTPGGCTIAALLILEDGKIRSVLARAVEEATQTAVTLGLNKKY